MRLCRGDRTAHSLLWPLAMEVQLAGRVPRASLPSDGWSQQLQELTQQNSDLLLQLDAKDGEIAVLEERLIALEPVAGGGGFGGPGSDPRDAKIIDLSKRNRALNMALEKKKSKCGRLRLCLHCPSRRVFNFPFLPFPAG